MRKFFRHVHAKIHTEEPFTHNDAKQMQRCTQTYNSQAQLPSLTSLSVCLSHTNLHTPGKSSCVSASLSGAATAACLWARPLPKPPRCRRKRESKKKWAGDQACAQCSTPYELNGLADGHVAQIKQKSETEAPEKATHLIQNFSSMRGRKGGKGISHLVFFSSSQCLVMLIGGKIISKYRIQNFQTQ